jgi:hypothetical protein
MIDAGQGALESSTAPGGSTSMTRASLTGAACQSSRKFESAQARRRSAASCLADIDYADAAAAATVGFGAGREIASTISAAMMHSAPATKKAGR